VRTSLLAPLLIPLALAAAENDRPTHLGFVHGTLIEGSARRISVRCDGNTVFHFSVDERTWIERDNERIAATHLSAGDKLEIVSDRPRPEETAPYARLVRVIPPAHPRRYLVSEGNYTFRHDDPHLVTAESKLIFSGLVISIDGAKTTIQTRMDGLKMIYLRADTVFVYKGTPASRSALSTNSRVFIRAGRNLDNELEAYEIVWGGIFDPEVK
jgi:hypothetical protein